MRAPRAIRLVGQRFAIDLVPREDPLLHQNADLTAVGTCLIASQRIIIAQDLAFDQERDTVIHEVLHGIVRIMGVALTARDEERVVGAMAPVLLDMIRRNPALVRYLAENEG